MIQEATNDLLEIVKEDDFDQNEIVVDWVDNEPAYVPDEEPIIDMWFDELDFVIQNVPFHQNEVRDEAVVVADEGPTPNVEDSLERADMDAPSTVDSPDSVTSGIQNNKRKLDPTDKDGKAIEADEEVDCK